MRLGLYGGTFDPIHLGHLILAETCREACGLDRVWFVVAGSPPHKPGGRTDGGPPPGDGPAGRRRQPGLRGLRDRGPPARARITASRPWRRPPRAARGRAVLPDRRRQPGRPPPLAGARADPAAWPAWSSPTGRGSSRRRSSRPAERPADPRVDDPARSAIASHEIRRLRREGRSVRYQVPRAVEAYIDAHGLYRPSGPG